VDDSVENAIFREGNEANERDKEKEGKKGTRNEEDNDKT
jgi:hypothetical protein